MRRIKHLVCNGTGKVLNPDFEGCRIHPEDYPGNCMECRRRNTTLYYQCQKGETIPCEGCDGKGILEFWEDEWVELERL